MPDGRIWLIDTEGNGANPSEIIELGIAEMVDLKLTGLRRTWRFRPVKRVNWYATRVHGIRDADLKTAPRIGDCLGEIAALIGTDPIAGHAIQIEMTALQRVMPKWRPIRAYDTLRMSKWAHPDIARHRLSAMGDHLGVSGEAAAITGEEPHSAIYDAVLSGLVLARLVEALDDRDASRMLHDAEIIGLQRAVEERRRQSAERKAIRRKMRQAAAAAALQEAGPA